MVQASLTSHALTSQEPSYIDLTDNRTTENPSANTALAVLTNAPVLYVKTSSKSTQKTYQRNSGMNPHRCLHASGTVRTGAPPSKR